MNDVSNAYFEWLCSLIGSTSRSAYFKLLQFLHDTDFRYSISRDGNRYEDGINLRYQFSKASGYSQSMVASELGGKACSVLEMMVALAARCEDQIMSNSDFGDRTGIWFWAMVESLGLKGMTNRYFNKQHCQVVIDRFLDREYQPNGVGGLFHVDVIDENLHFVDLRNYEIWYQAMCYLNSVLEGGNNVTGSK